MIDQCIQVQGLATSTKPFVFDKSMKDYFATNCWRIAKIIATKADYEVTH